MIVNPFHVGQTVRATRDIVQNQDDDEDTSFHLFAAKGTPLIVREVGTGLWDYFVANPALNPDTAFGVEADDIEAI